MSSPFEKLEMIPKIANLAKVFLPSEFPPHRLFTSASKRLVGKYVIGIDERNVPRLIVQAHILDDVKFIPEWQLIEEFFNSWRYDSLSDRYMNFKSGEVMFFKTNTGTPAFPLINVYQGKTDTHIFEGYFSPSSAKRSRKLFAVYITPFIPNVAG